MGGLVQNDLVSRPAVHRERHLVAHRARRQEERGLLAQQLGDRVLQLIHRRVLELLLVAHFGVAHEAAHRRGRAGNGVAVQVHRRDDSTHSTPPEEISMRSIRLALRRSGTIVATTSMTATASPGEQEPGCDAELLAVVVGPELLGHRRCLQHDHDREQAQAGHHVDHAAEAGGNLGRVLGAELRVEDPEGQRQRADGKGIEQDGAEAHHHHEGRRPGAASW